MIFKCAPTFQQKVFNVKDNVIATVIICSNILPGEAISSGMTPFVRNFTVRLCGKMTRLHVILVMSSFE